MVWTILAGAVFLVTVLAGFTKGTPCGQPSIPENGRVSMTSGTGHTASTPPFGPGSRARYACDTGFIHLGVEERLCVEDGRWTDQPPVCAVNVALYKPASQSSTLASSSDGAALGAWLAVDGQLEGACAATLQRGASWWTVDLLQQFDIFAVELLIASEGSTELDLEIYATFGYPPSSLDSAPVEGTLCARFKGPLEANLLHTFVCDTDGSAAATRGSHVLVRAVGAAPLRLCEVFVLAVSAPSPWQCTSLPDMENLSVHRGHCYFRSSTGRRLAWPQAQAHCLAAGAGASLPMEMRAIDQCSSPGVPENGGVMISQQPFAIGTSAYYYCGAGYRLSGAVTRLCEQGGVWSDGLPKCVVVDCGPPMAPANGDVTLESGASVYGAVARYRCRSGYNLSAAMAAALRPITANSGDGANGGGPTITRICQGDGSWSGALPVCELINCGAPPEVANATAHANKTTYGSVVEYRCKRAHRMIGVRSSVCGQDGRWLYEQLPQCFDQTTFSQLVSTDESAAIPALQSQINWLIITVCIVIFLLFVVLGAVFWAWRRRKLSDMGSSSAASMYAPGSMPTLGAFLQSAQAAAAAAAASDEHAANGGYSNPSAERAAAAEMSVYGDCKATAKRLNSTAADRSHYGYMEPYAGTLQRHSVSANGTNASTATIAGADDTRSNNTNSTSIYYATAPLVAARSAQSNGVAANGEDQSQAADTEIIVPAHLLKMHRLPDGNIHLTLSAKPAAQRTSILPPSGPPPPPPPLQLPRARDCPRTNSLPRSQNGPSAARRHKFERPKKFQTMISSVRKKLSASVADAMMHEQHIGQSERPKLTSHDIVVVGLQGGSGVMGEPASCITIARHPSTKKKQSAKDGADATNGRSLSVAVANGRGASPTPSDVLYSFDDIDAVDVESDCAGAHSVRDAALNNRTSRVYYELEASQLPNGTSVAGNPSSTPCVSSNGPLHQSLAAALHKAMAGRQQQLQRRHGHVPPSDPGGGAADVLENDYEELRHSHAQIGARV